MVTRPRMDAASGGASPVGKGEAARKALLIGKREQEEEQCCDDQIAHGSPLLVSVAERLCPEIHVLLRNAWIPSPSCRDGPRSGKGVAHRRRSLLRSSAVRSTRTDRSQTGGGRPCLARTIEGSLHRNAFTRLERLQNRSRLLGRSWNQPGVLEQAAGAGHLFGKEELHIVLQTRHDPDMFALDVEEERARDWIFARRDGFEGGLDTRDSRDLQGVSVLIVEGDAEDTDARADGLQARAGRDAGTGAR